MAHSVGIVGAALRVPEQRVAVRDILTGEGVTLNSAEFNALTATLGCNTIHLCDGETGSELALAAAQQVLADSGVKPAAIDVIIDFSIMPQEYLTPAWNMSNKIQHELGATKAFTLGFSGGGATNFIVALNAASALIRSEARINTALLVAADITIPGNRVLNPDQPRTILGDGASAVLIQQDAPHAHILNTTLQTHGAYHDVCYIPGGALAHPDKPELYRMQLDVERFDRAPKMDALNASVFRLLEETGLSAENIAHVIYPNISAADRHAFQVTLNLNDAQLAHCDGSEFGHLQGNDFVVNWLRLIKGGVQDGDIVVLCAHGMGFMTGATLLRF